MKILKVLRIKDGCYFLALLENKTVISINMYLSHLGISLNASDSANRTFELYEEDVENYEPMTTHSFNRALRLVKHRVDNAISKL